MIADLIQQGYFRQIKTEGRTTFILKSPVQVVVKAQVLQGLKRIYPLHEETGGVLWAYPVGGNLVINQFTQLPNNITGDARKTSYQPINSALVRNQVLQAGALPIRFHSHPVGIFDYSYDHEPLTFFQKTSVADRHNSYLPITIDGYTVVLPDGLLSANDRAGSDVRFYLYGGLVAPDSLKALLTSEKVYLYFAIAAVLLTAVFGSVRRAWAIFLLSAIASIAVFVLEKRPTGVLNAQGDLIISIP